MRNKAQQPSLINPTASENSNQGYSKRIQALEEKVTLLSYALQNVLKATADLPSVKSQVEALDYRTLGLLGAAAKVFAGVGSLPAAELDERPAVFTQFYKDLVETHAKEAKVSAFQELSDKDDELRGLKKADEAEIADTDTVIFTTDCETNKEAGILRSKVEVSAEGFEHLKDKFVGKKVGDQVDMEIYGQAHKATILGIRKSGSTNE